MKARPSADMVGLKMFEGMLRQGGLNRLRKLNGGDEKPAEAPAEDGLSIEDLEQMLGEMPEE